MNKIDEDAFEELEPVKDDFSDSEEKDRNYAGFREEGITPEEQRKELISYLIYLACVVIACLLFVRFVAVRSVVDGNSMYSTLSNGDNLIVEKVSYYFHAPERFDVVVFKLKDQKNVHYIKRVIGLPGETVQIIDGYVYINGEKLEGDNYCEELIYDGYTANEPVILGENEYFCMGDNRNNSKDSRSASVGPVDRKQIVGRAWIRFLPLKSIGKVR